MNIKRGLFRLWVVLAAIFVMTVAAFNVEPVKKAFEDKEKFDQWKDVGIYLIPVQRCSGCGPY
jgi:hypothetical protein